MFTGAYNDFEGSILVDNIPLANYDLPTLRSQTGILLNQQDIFQGTLMENITMGNPGISLKRLNELVEKTGLVDYMSTLPKGYDTELDATGKRLPRNVIHKILLVRALAHNPSLLLLEEPWQGLADKNKKMIKETLLHESRNTTLLVVTNDKEFHQQCDKIIFLSENGCVVTEGYNQAPSGGEGI